MRNGQPCSAKVDRAGKWRVAAIVCECPVLRCHSDPSRRRRVQLQGPPVDFLLDLAVNFIMLGLGHGRMSDSSVAVCLDNIGVSERMCLVYMLNWTWCVAMRNLRRSCRDY